MMHTYREPSGREWTVETIAGEGAGTVVNDYHEVRPSAFDLAFRSGNEVRHVYGAPSDWASRLEELFSEAE